MSDPFFKVQYLGLLFLIFLLPLFFLPITQDAFDFNKMALLVGGVLLLASFWALRGVYGERATFFTTSFDLPVLLVALVFILSTLFVIPEKINSLLFPGITTAVLGSTVLYFVVTQTIRNAEIRLGKVINVLFASGILLSLVLLAARIGILGRLDFLPNQVGQNSFSPIGALLATITYLLVLTVLALGRFLSGHKSKIKIAVNSLIASVLILGMVAAGSQILPGKPLSPRFLPLDTGWAIAIETLKKSPLGFGPGNFVQAFNQYRPAGYNTTSVWNTRFGNSSNWYLSLFTEVGIVGLLAFLFLVWRVLGFHFHDSALKASLFSVLILFLVLPINLILLVTFYLLLALSGSVWGREVSLGMRRALPAFVLLLVLSLTVAVVILGKRAYLGEVFYKQALSAAARNDGQGLYNALGKAIEENPRVDRYRILFSQANLAIADSLTKKDEVTDSDRETITKIVQQAITEAQVAVALNPKSATNWENLARVYRTLIPIAKGADGWAVAAYSRAIALDPVNPILWINLGGVHYGTGKYDEAVRSFEQAVFAKSDLANAHYNLAIALRDRGNIDKAIAAMEKTLSLVRAGSEDYDIAQKELGALKNKLATTGQTSASPGPGETLEAPLPGQAPIIKPPLELPQESGPPPEETPEPEPGTPGPTPIP